MFDVPFTFLETTEHGNAVYETPHEINNTVRITLPAGYFHNLPEGTWPKVIVLPMMQINAVKNGPALDESGYCPDCGRDYVVTADGPLESHCTNAECIYTTAD